MAIRSRKYYYRIPCFACCSNCQICKGEGGGEDLWRPNAIFMPTLWGCAVYEYTILRKAQTKWNIQLWGTNVKQKPFGPRHFHQRALLLCCFVFNANRRNNKANSTQDSIVCCLDLVCKRVGCIRWTLTYIEGQHHFLGCSREITYSESTTYWYSIRTQCCNGKHDVKIYTPANDDSARAYCCFVDLIVEFGNNWKFTVCCLLRVWYIYV
jgi:hypothetical protein